MEYVANSPASFRTKCDGDLKCTICFWTALVRLVFLDMEPKHTLMKII